MKTVLLLLALFPAKISAAPLIEGQDLAVRLDVKTQVDLSTSGFVILNGPDGALLDRGEAEWALYPGGVTLSSGCVGILQATDGTGATQSDSDAAVLRFSTLTAAAYDFGTNANHGIPGVLLSATCGPQAGYCLFAVSGVVRVRNENALQSGTFNAGISATACRTTGVGSTSGTTLIGIPLRGGNVSANDSYWMRLRTP